ncbi:hypothetical protein [Pseudotabrizicola algicola]|uniref:Uncharacterized protein n=1 Tax=Pseudotabrizicola algicola TaxID=2709381 RepID=A0A6B3RR35_9RHOB|nr:hypothetical protein [Pseudotabrizicola algicola]NEX47258.1 hypothetical protein [Pseudotabrizicola algicola]
MTLLGRFRAALGRDDATLLARARADLRLGLGLNPPACLPPLNRAIAALERLPNTSEVALMLGRALCAKARAEPGTAAPVLRARAVAKLRAMIDTPRVPATEKAALWAALAQAWMPLPADADNPDLCHRQLLRAFEAQTEALVVPSAAAHLVMAEIALALSRSPLCAQPRDMAEAVRRHVQAARALGPDADELTTAHALISATRALFPGPSGPATSA